MKGHWGSPLLFVWFEIQELLQRRSTYRTEMTLSAVLLHFWNANGPRVAIRIKNSVIEPLSEQ